MRLRILYIIISLFIFACLEKMPLPSDINVNTEFVAGDTTYLLIKISLNTLFLSLFHFLLTYSLVINLLGLPQYKHVGDVTKIKFLHWGHFFFFII